MPPLRTGLPSADAHDAFQRERRRRSISRLRRWIRGDPGDIDHILPFHEVVEALGRRGARDLGRQEVGLDRIVGTVDRPHGFDRSFRPESNAMRARWERIAIAMRRGETLPPIDLYKVGEVYFVRDGHHRVSVARALGLAHLEAHVREIITEVPARTDLIRAQLVLKSHERIFHERVPLPAHARQRIEVADPWTFAELAETIEAWGMRYGLEHEPITSREELARLWYEREYVIVVKLLRDAGMIGDRSETDAYMDVSCLRYRLLHTHEWSDSVIERMRERHAQQQGRGGSG